MKMIFLKNKDLLHVKIFYFISFNFVFADEYFSFASLNLYLFYLNLIKYDLSLFLRKNLHFGFCFAANIIGILLRIFFLRNY